MTEWILLNKKADIAGLGRKLGLSEIVCRVLANRGIADEGKAREYLSPEQARLFDPMLLKNAKEAGSLLYDAVKKKKKIRIIGDYDVDGVMATYILYEALCALEAQVDYRIPDRIADGYGMNMRMVEEAERDKVALLLTCDNGIAAAEPIRRAKEAGMEVIVTDHHDIPFHKEGEEVCYDMPLADLIVNPKQPGDVYPQHGICGAMVAYKVVCMLFAQAKEDSSFRQGEALLRGFLVPVAFATVCDVMELTGENRVAVAQGLALAQNCSNIGIRAMLDAYELGEKKLTAYHAGFVIGPCFNAAGRLDTALLGLELLLCRDEKEAKRKAFCLKELNDTRKQMTADATQKAILMGQEKLSGGNCSVLVLYLPECHESLAGIVAGRVKEHFYRPAIVLTKGEHCVKGSGRSVEGYSMFEKLSEQKELFLAFGGHPMAAGMSLEEENVELLEERLNRDADLTEADLTRKLYLDAVLPFSEISELFTEQLERLEPFGNGNTKPLFGASGVTVKEIRRIGKDGTTLRMRVTDGSGTTVTGLLFHEADEFESYIRGAFGEETVTALYRGTGTVKLTLAFQPSMDEYRGNKYPQIIIQAYKKCM